MAWGQPAASVAYCRRGSRVGRTAARRASPPAPEPGTPRRPRPPRQHARTASPRRSGWRGRPRWRRCGRPTWAKSTRAPSARARSRACPPASAAAGPQSWPASASSRMFAGVYTRANGRPLFAPRRSPTRPVSRCWRIRRVTWACGRPVALHRNNTRTVPLPVRPSVVAQTDRQGFAARTRGPRPDPAA